MFSAFPEKKLFDSPLIGGVVIEIFMSMFLEKILDAALEEKWFALEQVAQKAVSFR